MKTKYTYPRSVLIVNLAALVVCLAGFGIAFAQAHMYEAGIVRQQFTISGTIPTPVIHLMPAERKGNAIAIIVHGYSGDKELMIGFGLELAKMGVPSYLMDLPGFGESTVALDQQDLFDTAPQLESALDEVVGYVRAHSDVSNPSMVLLGHSLGTQVVGNYALNQPTGAIAATILVSPILHISPTANHPANVLYLVGENDISGLLGLAQDDMVQTCGLANASQLAEIHQACGVPGEGTGRKLIVVSGANHISILTDAAAFQAVDDWVAATNHVATAPVDSDTRLRWLLFGALCAVLAIIPLIALVAMLLRLRTAPDASATSQESPSFSLPARFGLMAGGVALTVVILRGWSKAAAILGAAGLRTPLTWMHMVLADYTGSFMLVLTLVLLVAYRLLRRPLPLPPLQHILPQVILGIFIMLALYLTIGTLSNYGWENFLLDTPRFWRFLLLAAVNLPLFAIIEAIFGADAQSNFWRATLPRLGALILILIGFIGAIRLDSSLFFLMLIVPIQGLLFISFAAYTYQTWRQGNATAWACAVFMSLIFAWSVSSAFPIVQ
jgi:pimeloyl-ACP methyl ester carboxylesterase